jgi:hypothetical protein
MKGSQGMGVFSTCRTSNDAISRLLIKNGFVRSGSSYSSTQNPGEDLELHLLLPKAASGKS